MPIQINEAIEQIIQCRKRERLPKIEKSIENYNKIKDCLEELQQTLNIINLQIDEQRGSYYAMVQDNPGMEGRLANINVQALSSDINKHIKDLNLLYKRFSREAVQIAFVGYERQGKSQFLQSITGLSNNVIPAYSGSSCTGTVSVIHNVDEPLRAHITFFTHDEIVAIVREKLKCFFPDRLFRINCIDDLIGVDISGFHAGNDSNLSIAFDKFVDCYIKHVNEYKDLLSTGEKDFYDETDIIQHVSQYEEVASIPEGKDRNLFVFDADKNVYIVRYYKYLAVKSVEIFTSFPTVDNAKIVLCDTIGMGDTANAQKIEEEMFRVLNEDCDAAVDVYRPENVGGFPKVQSDVLTKIGRQLSGRHPEKWMYFVVNKVVDNPKFRNVDNINNVLGGLESALKYMDKPISDYVLVDGNNKSDVFENLLTPLLNCVCNNLDQIDEDLVSQCEENGYNLFLKYKSLYTSLKEIATNSIKGNQMAYQTIRPMLQATLNNLSTHLNDLDDKYKRNKDGECKEVMDKLISLTDGIYDLVPNQGEIENSVSASYGRELQPVFAKLLKIMCNSIHNCFEKVSTDVLFSLQEAVKLDVIKVLYNEGGLGKIRLDGHNNSNEPSSEWLQNLINEKVDVETYPELHEALVFIQNYSISIDGLIEYNVYTSLGNIDTTNSESPVMLPPINDSASVSDKARHIRKEIQGRLCQVEDCLKKWHHSFALIPSHSFYARVNKFRTKIMDVDTDARNHLEDFYLNNSVDIWGDALKAAATMNQTYNQWNDVCQNIGVYCNQDYFIIK